MDAQEPVLFRPEPTLHPTKLGFVFLVPITRLRQDMVPTPWVTTYGTCSLPNRERLSEPPWKDHVFAEMEPVGGDHIGFRFVPVLTAAERETPIAGGTNVEWVKHPWDDWIVQLGALEDATQPINVEVAGVVVDVPRLFGRYYKLPGGLYTSRVTTEIYVSHEQFPDEMLNDVVSPVPTEVRFSSRNLQGSFTALHDDIEFEETQTSATVLDGWGTINHPLLKGEKSVFPATSPPGWIPHVFSAQQSLPQNGMRRLVKQRVDVPQGVEELVNVAL